MSGPRVFDGRQWTQVTEDSGASPILPVEAGDGTIFVSIASYRGMTGSLFWMCHSCLLIPMFRWRAMRANAQGLV